MCKDITLIHYFWRSQQWKVLNKSFPSSQKKKKKNQVTWGIDKILLWNPHEQQQQKKPPSLRSMPSSQGNQAEGNCFSRIYWSYLPHHLSMVPISPRPPNPQPEQTKDLKRKHKLHESIAKNKRSKICDSCI